MEILKRLILIGLCAFPFLGMTQIKFYNKYRSDSPFDSGNGITQLADSSYAITGSSGGFNENSSQAYLMLVDSLGNQLWTKDYGGWGDDIGVRVIHLPGDGYFIAGYTGSTSDGGFDFTVYKTDEQGNLEWEKQYGSSNWEILHDAQLLADGGLILVGQTEGPTTDGVDVYMVRTDALGDTLWTKTMSTPNDDIAYAVDTLSSNKFVIGGDFGDGGVVTGMLAVFENDGTLDWQKFYNQDGVSMIRDITVFDNKIFTVGATQGNDPKPLGLMFKTDIDGNHLLSWSETFFSNSLITAFTIRDQFSLYLSYISDAPGLGPYPGGHDAFVSKYAAQNYGYIPFSASFSAQGEDRINQMIVANDGGITLVGTSSDAENGEPNHLGKDVMVIKIGPNDDFTDDANVGNDLVSVKEEDQVSELPIYPNPTQDVIQIPDVVLGMSYKVLDARGKKVKQGKLTSTLSLEKLDLGLYFLKVKGEHQNWSAKVIKQ